MLVKVFNDNLTKTQEIEAISLEGPINSINHFKLYMSDTEAKQIYSWAYEFEINGERYHSTSAHHTLQNEGTPQKRFVKLAKNNLINT